MRYEVKYLEDNGSKKKDQTEWLDGMIVTSMVNRGVVKATGRTITTKDFNKGLIPKDTPKKTRKPRKKKEE